MPTPCSGRPSELADLSAARAGSVRVHQRLRLGCGGWAANHQRCARGIHRRAAGLSRQRAPHGPEACGADCRRERRDRPLPDRAGQDLWRDGPDAALDPREIRRARRQPDDDVHRAGRDLAHLAGDRGAEGISAFVVEPKTMPGITFGRHERKMGWRGAPNTPIFLDKLRVPAENLIGEEGKGFKASMRALDLHTARPSLRNVWAWPRARWMRRWLTPRSASSSAKRLPNFKAPVHAGRHGDEHRGGARPGL